MLIGCLGVLMFAPSGYAGKSALPPVRELLPEEDALSAQPTVFVKEFRFTGNTAFTDEELATVVADYTGREVATEDLHQARQALTLHYVNRGYINSGAVLPDQTVTDGVITFLIVEGELSEVEITGNEWTKPGYIEERVARGAGRPLNILGLEDTLEVMRQYPIFERLKAELSPGVRPGESRLTLDVEEDWPIRAALEFANDENPSVGAERFRLLLGHGNLTGVNDALDLRYGLTTGGISEMEFAGLDDVALGYRRSVTVADTELVCGYVRSDSLLREPVFQELDITSETETFKLGVRHPVYRTPDTECALSLTGEVRSNETELMGRPFSFWPGAESGETDVTVLRFAQGWVTRGETRAFAARSTFTLGLPIMGATEHGDLPDGQFLAWLGQGQYVQRLWNSGNRFVFRLTGQISDDALLPLEQFGIGGVRTVRGYRENQIVRDNGVVASAELRVPVLEDRETNRPIVQLVPFLDFGYGWNKRSPGRYEDIGSAGLGLLFDLDERVRAELYWGAGFSDFDQAEYDLQDLGIHFRILVGFL